MRKVSVLLMCTLVIGACDKHDPILPGVRDDIFASQNLRILNQDVPNLPANANSEIVPCKYTRDDKNRIFDGDKKVYIGFPTTNSVRGAAEPVCSGAFVYAGLSTGELIKINPNTRTLIWSTDVYRTSNMTGGATLVDIVAAPVVVGNYVYVGGLGDALCKLNASNGRKVWCDEIGIANNFIIAGDTLFATGTDNALYAINTKNGDIYWRTDVKKQKMPVYQDKVITVGREKIDACTGNKL